MFGSAAVAGHEDGQADARRAPLSAMPKRANTSSAGLAGSSADPNEAEEGTHQWVYWTDGIEIHRRMQGGVWRYETEDEVENKEEYGR